VDKVIANRYEVKKLLGEGLAGKVYLVKDGLREGTPLALKLLETPDAHHLELMRHEFSILTKLRHPGIARVYDFGFDEESGFWFYTSEYIEGRNMVKAGKKSGFAGMARLFAQVLRALQYVHSRGIIHYDVKPGNIIVNADGEAKLIDFGLATTETPVSGAMRGTIGYAAPEVVRGELGDPRSDLYSLGIVFYEALAGRRPFVADSALEVLRMQSESEPEPLRKLNKKVPAELERIVLRLLRRDPSGRFFTANEVNRALSRALDIPLEEETVETARAYLSGGGFVGRDSEFETFRSLISGLESGSDGLPFWFVTGETGIGKSRLLRETGYYAQLSGVLLIRGRCASSDSRPFGPFADVVGGLAGILPKKLKKDFDKTVKTLAGKSRAGGEVDRNRFMNDAATLIMEAARQRPALIIIDDIEEADEDTLALLEHLARVLWLTRQKNERARLLVLCGCNTEVKSADAVKEFITRREAGGIAGRVDLSPLSDEAQRKLLSAMFGGAGPPETVAKTVLDAAGGNPLIIEQTVQQLFDSKLLFYEFGKWRASPVFGETRLPVGGEGVLKQRVKTFTEDRRAVAEALACAGRPADFELLCAASGMPAGECAAAVEQLLARRILTVDERGDYAFASGRMGEMAKSTITRGRLKKLHRRIYEHLSKGKPDLIELALHAEMAGVDDDELVPLLRDAADHAVKSSAISSAARLYEALKERIPAGTEEWFKVLDQLAAVYWRSADLDGMFDCISTATRKSLWKYPRYAVRVVLLHNVGQMRFGRIDKAEKFLKEARKKLTGKEAKKYRAEILEESARIAEFKGEMREARKLLLQARRIYASRREKKKVDYLDNSLAHIDWRSERYADAAKRARMVLRRKTGPELPGHLHNLLGTVCLHDGKPSKALEHYRLSRKAHEKAGNLLGTGVAQANMGLVFRDLGEYEKSFDSHTAAKHLFEVYGDELSHGGALLNTGDLHLALGRTKEALHSIGQALESARKISNPLIIRDAFTARGRAHSALGNTKAALADIEKALELAREADAKTSETIALFHRAYLSAFLCGDFKKAEKDLARARTISKPGNPVGVGQALALSARLLAVEGKGGEALKLVERAQKLKLRGPAERSIRLAKAEALIAAGKTGQAKKILAALGAKRLSVPDLIRVEIMNARSELKAGTAAHALAVLGEALVKARRSENVVLVFDAAAAAAGAAIAADDIALAVQYISEAEGVFDRVAAALPGKYKKPRLRSSPFYRVLDALKKQADEKKSKPAKPGASGEELLLEAEILEVAGVDGRVLAREGLALLGMVSRLAAAEPDVEKVLNLALGMVLDLTRAGRGFIILVDGDGNLRHLAARNILDEEITSPEYETSYTMVREVLRTGRPVLVADTALDESLREARSVIDLGLRSVLSMPIVHEGRATGVVYLDSTSLVSAFTDADLALVEAFAGRVAPIIANAVEQARLKIKMRSLQEETETRYRYTNIVGRAKPMRELFRVLDSVTDTDLPVCIYGETGTGKELVAKALHYNSSRKDAPFISINCGALAETLLDSELFGHVRGAFTGADANKAGLIEAAGRGTLFLDEIGSMPLEMQVKLLRVIEEREVRRIGSTLPVPVDIRLVCSTNVPLEQLVEQGSFREDLFYRINVVLVDLPPLRKRSEDIPLLAEHFLKEFAAEQKSPEKQLMPEALARLVSYNYPGNVRQLRNILQQAFIISGSHIDAADVENLMHDLEYASETQAAVTRELSIEEYTKEFILSHQNRCNETELAEKLGITRTNLWQKRKKWKMPRPE